MDRVPKLSKRDRFLLQLAKLFVSAPKWRQVFTPVGQTVTAPTGRVWRDVQGLGASRAFGTQKVGTPAAEGGCPPSNLNIDVIKMEVSTPFVRPDCMSRMWMDRVLSISRRPFLMQISNYFG